jgi:RNA polymerase sporulation-specific sigma factor
MDVVCEAQSSNPEQMLISREEYDDIEEKLSRVLSDLERKVLRQYLDGRTYQEISVDLKRHVKSIDNALQRVKRKLEHCMHLEEFSI